MTKLDNTKCPHCGSERIEQDEGMLYTDDGAGISDSMKCFDCHKPFWGIYTLSHFEDENCTEIVKET